MRRVFGLAGLLLMPGLAAAHAFLDGAQPRVGSHGRAPTQVVLHFTQAVEPAFSTLEVRNAGGDVVTRGSPHTLPDDPARLAIGLPALPGGDYTVTWHAVSVDTHRTQGRFHFTVEP